MNETTPFGLITTIKTLFALYAVDSCWSKKGVLLVNYILENENESISSRLVYTFIDERGEIKEIIGGNDKLPILFISPKKENCVLLQQERSEQLCVFSVNDALKKEQLMHQEKLDSIRFAGIVKSNSIFYGVDIWNENREDVLFSINFQDDKVQSEVFQKIPFPKGNKISVRQDEIHLITEVESGWLHRQLDEEGKELKERILDFDLPFVHEALILSFTSNSYLLTEENGEIGIVEIDLMGDCSYGKLYDIGDEFFGTWFPVQINKNTSVVQFTTEFGNGWLVVKEDELLELFYNKNKQGYRNLLTNEVLYIGDNDLTMSSISPSGDNKFGIIFHPRKRRKEYYNEIYILQRELTYC